MFLALLIGAQAESVDRLSAFKPFIGACWRASFSPTVSDTHCFETVYGGAHVRDRHQVREGGKTVYAGETIYSADGADVVFTYFNSLGGVGNGKVRSAGATIRFSGTMRASPTDVPKPIDSEWRVAGADRYEVRPLVKAGSASADKPLVFTRIR